MQGFAEKKKEVPKLFEDEKKKLAAPRTVNASTMSEGPMLLKESLSVEQHGRVSFEQSVKIELAAMKKLKDRKKKGKKRKKKGKAKKKE
ncbi:MAG: hypothetical protein WCT52_02400 [Candidatus Micrarchaeia archaeon]